MTRMIDRRLNGRNKNAVNRQKFLRRYRAQIKQAVDQMVARRNLTDMGAGGQVHLPARDLSEPSFGMGAGGVVETVHPGNIDFVAGDRLQRPRGSDGDGSNTGAGGGGEDAFVFELSPDEFMHFFFDDMALPNLARKRLAHIMDEQKLRAGYTTDGVPANIHVLRSLKNALGRRIALGGRDRRAMREALAERARLAAQETPDAGQLAALDARISALRTRLARIPWLDPFDLRYRNLVHRQRPATQAVMFCIMDVSGSMDQAKKDLAKRFFVLLYLFLTRTYARIQLVFIRHHAAAEEVDEDRFFNQRETGGTLVSSALELARDIMDARYAADAWNIYVAQASDGDNMSDDSPVCREILDAQILPKVQYYAYVEISAQEPQNLWEEYARLRSAHAHFAMQRINDATDIYPALHDLFRKQPS